MTGENEAEARLEQAIAAWRAAWAFYLAAPDRGRSGRRYARQWRSLRRLLRCRPATAAGVALKIGTIVTVHDDPGSVFALHGTIRALRADVEALAKAGAVPGWRKR